MYMVMYVPESKTFLLVESEIMGFGIQNQLEEFGFPLTIKIWNPISTDQPMMISPTSVFADITKTSLIQ